MDLDRRNFGEKLWAFSYALEDADTGRVSLRDEA